MKIHMMQGWRLAFKHFHLVILLFLYQLLWGFLLYRFVDSVVAPLLRRFPSAASSPVAVQTFLTEAQFQLFKTDLISSYAWIIGGLFVVRMLLSPLFNAGLFYSIHHQKRDNNGGTHFLEGIRKAWRPVMLLYWLEAALAIAPAWWLLPRGLQLLVRSNSIPELLMALAPGAAAWLLWGTLLHLLFLAMQFGAVSGEGVFHALWRSVKHFASFSTISLLMWGIGAALGLLVTSLSLLWAGLFALIVHQGYNLIRTLLKVWTIATQYDSLQSKS